jgi:hypothetical protein
LVSEGGIQLILLDAAASGSESVPIWDCDSEDGIGACPVDAQLVGNNEPSTVVARLQRYAQPL